MISEKELKAEDYDEINNLRKTIAEKLMGTNVISVIQDLTLPVRVGREMLAREIKDKSKYYFTDEFALITGLKQFFSNPYLPKRLAQDVYMYDEDEVFKEAINVELLFSAAGGLGEVIDKKGILQKTTVLEIEFKALPWQEGAVNKHTNLPFDIECVRLIPED